MSGFGESLGYNIFGQSFARVISFGLNMYLLRVVDNEVLGLVNVRLALLYNTILFLTREPMRKANILKTSVPQFINLIWLSPLICISFSIVCILLWTQFSTSSIDVPTAVLLSFPLSALIESLAEPFAVISLRYSLGRHFAIAQSLLILLQRVFAFGLIFSLSGKKHHLNIFAVAQVLASVVYLLFHYVRFFTYSRRSMPELSSFPSFRSFFPQPSAGLDIEALSSVGTLLGHSILKQFLTDGSSYVMTFTDKLSLTEQAVFDAIERLGSLVARILLTPLEENCYAEFSNQINKRSDVFGNNSDSHDGLVKKFTDVLHMATVIGLVVCAFGVPYSRLAVSLYGGSKLADNGGGLLLSLYSVYVFVMAVNGITECFAMASMNNKQVFSHGRFLLLAAVVNIALNVFLCVHLKAAGFILANGIIMLLRILYSWSHISSYLGDKTPSYTDILPNGSTFVLMVFTLFATVFSFLIFGIAPARGDDSGPPGLSHMMGDDSGPPGLSHMMSHIAVGGVMFLLLSYHIYHSDHTFQAVIDVFYKKHAD